jgi:hypothetical protein
LVNDYWISLFHKFKNHPTRSDWRNVASNQFQLLSELCQLANEMTHDAIRRFITQSFIVSTALGETDFRAQLDIAVDQFFQSTISDFALLVNTVGLLTQVDQPYMGKSAFAYDIAPMLIVSNIADKQSNDESVQVGDYWNR